MMNSWNSVVFMRSMRPMSEVSALKEWKEVDSMWSTSGKWDWCVKLNAQNSTPEMTEAFVNRMREGKWATETSTQWWKSVE